MAELVSIWNREICPRLDLMRLLSGLSPRQTGANVYLRCPVCGEDNSAFIKKGWDMIKCNRDNNCGAHVNIIAYLNGGTMPTGKEWVNWIRRLGKEVGCTIPEREYTPEQIVKFEAERKARSAMEQIFDLCKTWLATAPTALEYINARQLPADQFGYMNVVSLVQKCKDRAVLQDLGFIKDDGTISEAWNGRLIFPIYDRHGIMRGLAGRALKNVQPKFLKTKNYPKDEIILEGLEVAKKFKHIMAGESSMAVFSFRQAGLSDMTAAGGTDWKPETWETLHDWSIESVTLCFDDDDAGAKGERRAIEAAVQASRRPDIYVIPHHWLEGMDPDEVLRKHGKDKWNKFSGQRKPMDTYYAELLRDEHDLSTAIGMQRYLDAAAKYLAAVDDPRQSTIAWEQFFREGVQKITGCDEETFFDFVIDQKAKREEQRVKDELAQAAETMRQAAYDLDIQKSQEVLGTAAQKLAALDRGVITRPLLRADQRLAAHDNYLKEHAGKEFLGLPQRTLPTVDEATLGLRGLTGIAGGPGSGKTTMALQVGEDILKANPDTCMYILSLEMTEEELLARMKSRALKIGYDRLLLSNDDQMRQAANRLVSDVCARTFIADKSIYPEPNVDLILRDITRLKEETGCSRVVVIIDYLQIYPIPRAMLASLRTDIEKDCWLIDQMYKLRRALRPDPVIFISEVSKADGFKGGLDSIKGSGRIVYAADNVLILSPIDDDDLLDRIELEGKNFKLKPIKPKLKYSKRKKDDLSEDDKAVALEMMIDEMEKQGKAFVDLAIAKVRSGKRKRLTLVHRHICSDMKELNPNGEAA